MSIRELGKRIYYFPKPNRWTKGIGAELPEAYKKFWKEWKLQKPEAVHYIEKKGLFERNEKTGEVLPVQNVPIPVKYPQEMHDGIWGGEGIVQGYMKRHYKRRRFPRFWIPKLKKTVVYSEILNKYMSVVVTDRTIDLILSHQGFDFYILQTPACDLKSELALRLKREMLLALVNKTLYMDKPEDQEKVYDKYKKYLDSYTKEEIEWYGLNYTDACKKHIKAKQQAQQIVPLKILYRAELLQMLEEEKLAAQKRESKE